MARRTWGTALPSPLIAVRQHREHTADRQQRNNHRKKEK
jgi:hypothetical protein